MSKIVIRVLLAASLLLNLAAMAGFVYQRRYAAIQPGLVAVAGDLGLNETERAELVALRRVVRDDIRDGVAAITPASRDFNRLLAERDAGDPEIRVAIDRIADGRRRMQEQLAVRITAFRDTLSPPARIRFADMARRPGFVFTLLGLYPARSGE